MNTTVKIFIIVLVVLVPFILASYFYWGHSPVSQVPVFSATPTPIPGIGVPAQFTNQVANYSISYPSTFSQQQNIEQTDQATTFTYTKDNKTYAFQIIPGGTAGLQAYNQKVDSIVNKIIYVGDIQFMESIWYFQEKPFFVSAVPNEEGVTPITFQMQLPDTDSTTYLNTFTTIVQNAQLSQQQTLPTPMVTLQAPGTITVSK